MFTTRVAGTTGNASDLITRMAREQFAFRQRIHVLLEAGRRTSIPCPSAAHAAARHISPKREVSPTRVKEVAAAAVLTAASSIAGDSATGQSGEPDDPGQTCDEVHDW